MDELVLLLEKNGINIRREKNDERFLRNIDVDKLSKLLEESIGKDVQADRRTVLSSAKYRFSKPDKPDSSDLSSLESSFPRKSIFEAFEKGDAGHEVEVRFKDVKGFEFSRLFEHFNIDRDSYREQVLCVIENYSGYRRKRHFKEDSNLRTEQDVQIQTKRQLSKIFTDFGFSVVVSSETPTEDFSETPKRIVYKNMFKYYFPKKSSVFYNLELTLSVELEDNIWTRYGVEIERIGRVSATNVLDAVRRTLSIMKNGDVKIARLWPVRIYEDCLNSFRSLFGTRTVKTTAWQVLPFNPHLSRKAANDFVGCPYYVTKKLAGVRCLLYQYNRGIFILYMDDSIHRIGDAENEYRFVLDVELYGNRFYAFDLLHLSPPVNVPAANFSGRYKRMFELVSTLRSVHIECKHFTLINDLDDITNVCWMEDSVDGLIFQPNTLYKQGTVFKWKPKYLNTVDIRIGWRKSKRPTMFGIKTSIAYDTSNMVMECAYNDSTEEYYPLRPRFEKLRPNPENVVDDTIQLVKNPFKIEFFKGYGLSIARKLINTLKTAILVEIDKSSQLGSAILDIGSGQGGDIGKWKDFKNITKIVAVERDREQLVEFNRRAKEYPKLDIDIVNETFPSKTLKCPARLSAIIMFFSVNYVYENSTSVKAFTRMLKRCLTMNRQFIYILAHDKTRFEDLKSFISIEHSQDGSITTSVPGTRIVNIKEYPFNSVDFVANLRSENLEVESTFIFDKSSRLISVPNFYTFSNIFNLSIFEKKWLESIVLIRCSLPSKIDTSLSYTADYITADEQLRDNIYETDVNDDDADADAKSIDYGDVAEEVDEEDEVDEVDEERKENVFQEVEPIEPIDFKLFTCANLDISRTCDDELIPLPLEIRNAQLLKSIYFDEAEYFEGLWTITMFFLNVRCIVLSTSLGKNNLRIIENLRRMQFRYKIDVRNKTTITDFRRYIESAQTFTRAPLSNDDSFDYFVYELDGVEYISIFVSIPLRSTTDREFPWDGGVVTLIVSPFEAMIVLTFAPGDKSIKLNDLVKSARCHFEGFNNWLCEQKDYTKAYKLSIRTNLQYTGAFPTPVLVSMNWRDNSCYADSVLSIVGLSNLRTIFFSRSETIAQIFRSPPKYSKDVILEVGFEIGVQQCSAEFYTKLAEMYGITFECFIRDETATRALITPHEINVFRPSLSEPFFVLHTAAADKTGASIDVEAIVVPEVFFRKETYGGRFELQGCILYKDRHYTSLYKYEGRWYYYDSLNRGKSERMKGKFLTIMKNFPGHYILLSFYSNEE